MGCTSCKKDASNELADKLVRRGCSVEQLLKFYYTYQRNGEIRETTTTSEVVSKIIIPETIDPPRCYMESAFMTNIGGGKRAERLVSHAWKSRFVNTVLNIVLDATDWSVEDFTSYSERNHKDPYYADGVLNAGRLLKNLKEEHLQRTYWLCIFAINEHTSICGDCWTCNNTKAWLDDPVAHLKANKCRGCGIPKANPCSCGSIKWKPGHPKYELDKFPAVVSQMSALVVSLDPDMVAIKRVWVVAEIGQAITFTTIFFRMGLGLSQDVMKKLKQGTTLMNSVEECESTSSHDRDRILEGIKAMDGGVASYDEFINCMLDLQFGVSTRLPKLFGQGAQAMSKLTHLEMNLRWFKEMTHTGQLFREPDAFKALKHLKNLQVNARVCKNLVSIDGLDKALSQCQGLVSVTFDFYGCSALASIDELGKGLGQCGALVSADFDFSRCSTLISLDEFGKGLGQCHTLTSAKFRFKYCTSLESIDEFGKGLGNCKALQSAAFDFRGSSSLTSIDAFGRGLCKCEALTYVNFDFVGCWAINTSNDFGEVLGQRPGLQFFVLPRTLLGGEGSSEVIEMSESQMSERSPKNSVNDGSPKRTLIERNTIERSMIERSFERSVSGARSIKRSEHESNARSLKDSL